MPDSRMNHCLQSVLFNDSVKRLPKTIRDPFWILRTFAGDFLVYGSEQERIICLKDLFENADSVTNKTFTNELKRLKRFLWR